MKYGAGVGAVVMLCVACNGGGTELADAPGEDAGAPVDAALSPFLFTPASLDFGYVMSGTVSGSLHISIDNVTATPIAGFQLSLTGDDAIDLGIEETTCTATLVDGCELRVHFAPKADGEHTMQLVASAPGQASASAAIHAIGGVAPHDFGLLVGPVDFGFVTVGTTATQLLTFKNFGTHTLPPISYMFAGADATQYHLEADQCTGVQLPGHGTCTVALVFAPTTVNLGGSAILYCTAGNTVELDLHGGTLIATTLAIAPDSYDFGAVRGASPLVPFTITNTGSVTATGIDAMVFNPQFVVGSSTCSAPLAPGATCVMTAQVVPVDTGPIGGGLRVGGSNTGRADATFTAIGIPAEGVIVDTWRHDFGATAVDEIGSSFTFSVTNVGTQATPLAFSYDDAGSQFPIVQDGCTGAPLAAGATCMFEVVFMPTAAGGGFARIHVTSATNDAIVVLTATPLPPLDQPLSILPGQYDYGNDAIGQILTETLLVTNPGAVTKVPTVSVTGASASELVLAHDTCTGASLPYNTSCTVDVIYKPATVGTKTAALEVAWTGHTVSAPLSARAFQATEVFISSDPPAYDFGAIAVGQTASVTLPFANHGATTSDPVTFQLSGINPGEFSLTGDTCTGAVLATGDGCMVGVVFAPTSAGIKHASLIVTGGFSAALTAVGN